MSTYGTPQDSLFGRMDAPRRTDAASSGRHPVHRMHTNSMEAWKDMDADSRDREVCEALAAIGRPATDREVCRRLGKPDMNYGRPSITRLRDAMVLVEIDKVKCNITGRKVRRVWFAGKEGTA